MGETEGMQMLEFINQHKYALIAFIGAFLVAIGTFSSSLEQKKSEDKAAELNKKLQKESMEVKRLQELTITLQEHQNQELQHQTNLLTGGNSYPLVIVTPKSNDEPHLYELSLWVSGKYPLFGFSMQTIYTDTQGDIQTVRYQMDEIIPMRPISMTDLKFDLQNNPDMKITVRMSA
tara:strand:+ start:132 stop:659 length:528 start_codon:yes stop_codon:yes gene_type:complete